MAMIWGMPFFVRSPDSCISLATISDRRSDAISSRRAPVRMSNRTSAPLQPPTLTAWRQTAASSSSVKTRSRHLVGRRLIRWATLKSISPRSTHHCRKLAMLFARIVRGVRGHSGGVDELDNIFAGDRGDRAGTPCFDDGCQLSAFYEPGARTKRGDVVPIVKEGERAYSVAPAGFRVNAVCQRILNFPCLGASRCKCDRRVRTLNGQFFRSAVAPIADCP